MNPDKIFLVFVATFIILLITHYLALKIGWNMGQRADRNYTEPAKTKKNVKQEKYIDPFTEEFLDFE